MPEESGRLRLPPSRRIKLGRDFARARAEGARFQPGTDRLQLACIAAGGLALRSAYAGQNVFAGAHRVAASRQINEQTPVMSAATPIRPVASRKRVPGLTAVIPASAC